LYYKLSHFVNESTLQNCKETVKKLLIVLHWGLIEKSIYVCYSEFIIK